MTFVHQFIQKKMVCYVNKWYTDSCDLCLSSLTDFDMVACACGDSKICY
jgi:hypothetical protein